MTTFFFFYFLISELPSIERVKKCIERIAVHRDKIGASIAELDEKLADEMAQLSYAIFCYQKQQFKTFTVLNDRKLKAMRIAEDDDGLNEEDNIFLMDYFKNYTYSLEAFSELVAQSYILAKPKLSSITEQRLFCISAYSRYSGEEHTIFFYNEGNQFYIFKDIPTAIRLSDYITDYFSIAYTKEINELASSVLSPGKSYAEIQKEVSQVFSEYNKKSKHQYDFIPGAITFLDFLAWKGLWQSQDAGYVLREISELIDEFNRKLNDMSQALFGQDIGIDMSKLISISDTIAIFTPKVSTVSECDLLELHAELAKYIIERCSNEKYPIRGAISYGEYNLVNNIMIGPGIDECAGWHETGNWIGVHFTPTAQIYLNNCSQPNANHICKYKIPLKNGLEVEYCVKWSITQDIFNQLALNTKSLLNNKTSFTRQIFTIFHEIYHLYCKEPDVYLPNPNDEKSCDKFASEFLIPDDDFITQLYEVCDFEDTILIQSLANEYKVSPSAIAYRLKTKN